MPNATPTTAPTAVASAVFSALPETVWAYRLDFANLPGYNPDVSDVARIADGNGDGPGGVLGPGARYSFALADPRKPDVHHPVELWTVETVFPTLVAAGMSGGNDAYEEFVVQPRAAGGCEATLTLWVALPDDLPDDVRAAAAASSLESISMELRLMKEVLDGG